MLPQSGVGWLSLLAWCSASATGFEAAASICEEGGVQTRVPHIHTIALLRRALCRPNAQIRNPDLKKIQQPPSPKNYSGTRLEQIANTCYPRGMSPTPPHPDDMPVLRPTVAHYRRLRLRHYGKQSAAEMALLRYRELRPDEDAHTARGKVMGAIRWAEAEFLLWMQG